MAPDEVISPTGRWAGKLTGRPLPEADATVDALNGDDRDALVEIWLGRAANERRVSDSFVVVADALTALCADPALIELARRAVDDELRHAELCRIVASRIAGCELAPPPRLTLVVPPHATASPALRHLLHVVGQSCLNETIASAVLEASLAHARGSLVSAALRELLSDEIDHARIGWALLAATSEPVRAKIEPWIAPLVRGNVKMWRETPRRYATNTSVAAQGALTRDQSETTLLAAVQDLILPAFDRLGISTTDVCRWLRAGAPTA